MCGENLPAPHPASDAAGSSPRVRGKPWRTAEKRRDPRLIPACAGKTIDRRSHGPRPGAHPRVCGENGWPCHQPSPLTGSSPRVRGKQFRTTRVTTVCGLIPACAGKTQWPLPVRFLHRAHPRVCGENSCYQTRPSVFVGSSPRVRGKLPLAFLAAKAGGLIPACAGKTA